jgi:micrococcal nuclease
MLWSLFALLLTLVSALPAVARDSVTVVRVVDGDTLDVTLKGRPERIRLIGVDTPEKYESKKLHRDATRTQQDVQTIKALGERASRFTQRLVHLGSQVQLEYDHQARDRYERLLAFVWLPDGRMLNEALICEGYANASTRYPFRQDYMDRFRACERAAREQGKGLWGDGLTEQAAPVSSTRSPVSTQEGAVKGNRRSRIYHLPECPNYNDISPATVVPFSSEQKAVAAGYRKAKNCP